MSKMLLLVAGLILTMLGTVLLMYQDVTITTQAQKVLDIGPLQATTQQTRSTIPVSPIVGGVLVLAGAAAVFVGAYAPRFRRPKQAKAPALKSEPAAPARRDAIAS